MTTTTRFRFALVAAVILVSGCKETAAPPVDTTAPLAAVAKITYATDSALIFTSRVVAIRDLVKAYDAAGNELPSSRLSLSIPAGWSLRNDSIVTPANERAGKLTATAKATGGASLAEATTDETVITSALDMRGFTWTASWKCYQPAPMKVLIGGPNNAPIDSAHYAAVVDSTSYAGQDAAFIRNYGGVATVWWKGIAHFWYRDGTDVVANVSDPIPLSRQAPDSLVFDPSYATNAKDKLVATRGPGGGFTYTGGSWCRSFEWAPGTVRGPVTLTGTTKAP